MAGRFEPDLAGLKRYARRSLAAWVAILAAVAAGGVLVAGCGSDSSPAGSSSVPLAFEVTTALKPLATHRQGLRKGVGGLASPDAPGAGERLCRFGTSLVAHPASPRPTEPDARTRDRDDHGTPVRETNTASARATCQTEASPAC